MTSEVSRRGIIIGLGASLVAAPAIVRASSLMKVKPGNRETTERTARWLAEIEADRRARGLWVVGGDPGTLLVKWSAENDYTSWEPSDATFAS